MENLQHRWSNNLRKNLNKLHCATGYWLPCSLFKFFLKLLDQWCWRFSKGYLNNFSTELSTQIFDCCPRNFLIQEERTGNVISTSHWIRPVFKQKESLCVRHELMIPCHLVEISWNVQYFRCLVPFFRLN